jgi:hypothetical protein
MRPLGLVRADIPSGNAASLLFLVGIPRSPRPAVAIRPGLAGLAYGCGINSSARVTLHVNSLAYDQRTGLIDREAARVKFDARGVGDRGAGIRAGGAGVARCRLSNAVGWRSWTLRHRAESEGDALRQTCYWAGCLRARVGGIAVCLPAVGGFVPDFYVERIGAKVRVKASMRALRGR